MEGSITGNIEPSAQLSTLDDSGTDHVVTDNEQVKVFYTIRKFPDENFAVLEAQIVDAGLKPLM
jgi:hypothetical protein